MHINFISMFWLTGRRNDWCFLCEFENHLDRANYSRFPFSPMNIISRLPNIGGNLGYGRQEDAHELMRFAIDMMQSVCLDEFGGEKVVPPRAQETTLIQYIFGGLLQSQVCFLIPVAGLVLYVQILIIQ
jgi:ubiquitin carboxyl-terminal hydrolase 36/42